mmetsp:Transcript_92000/g.297747  ORF Transcript_92000/g.297747 Transcript_92000/m.297747 type:complete len:269 (+) Transcript_92000:66-872(+)
MGARSRRQLCVAAALSVFLALLGRCRPRVFVSGAVSATGRRVGSGGLALKAHWMDFLRFGGSAPSFDVLARTQEYAAAKKYEDKQKYYATDYVFRGSIIGPITDQDRAKALLEGFDIMNGYPDLEAENFGFHVDPQNPFRCLYFERWSGTHTGQINFGPLTVPATGNRVELPAHVVSVTWNPEGSIAYESWSPPIDRFEGNTKGAGGIYGLLVGAGLESNTPAVGGAFLVMQQKLLHALGTFGKSWSDDDDLPSWWKSKARGAEPNDI